MTIVRRVLASCSLGLSLGLVCVAAAHGAAQEKAAVTLAALDLKKLSIEELMDLEVTSVSKYSERLADAPSSIFVITPDVIHRSGVTSCWC